MAGMRSVSQRPRGRTKERRHIVWSRLWSFMVGRRYWVVIGLLVLAAFALGWVGWRTTDDSLGFWTTAYRAIRLFVLEGGEDSDISPSLAVARFVAPMVISGALVAVTAKLIGGLLAATSAKRQRSHTVVLGGGPESIEIARRAHRSRGDGGRAVIIGDLDAAETPQLGRERIIHLPAADDVVLRKVLLRASLIVICTPDDTYASGWVDRVRRAGMLSSERRAVVLLSDRALADDWRAVATDVTVLCRSSQVATAVLRQYPPYAEDAVTPAPIVIGDGRVAAELAVRIIEGWQRPAERFTVHCVGRDQSWAQAVAESTDVDAHVERHVLPQSAHGAPRVVAQILEKWRMFRPDRYPSAPAVVYISFGEDTVTIPIANAVARALPAETCVVVAVLADPELLSVKANKVNVVGQLELLCDPAHLSRDMVDDLAEQIVADLGYWPGDVPTAFGQVRRGERAAATIEGQTPEVRAGITRVAAEAVSILENTGFGVLRGSAGRASVHLLDPAELAVVARALARLLPAQPGGDDGMLEPDAERHTRLLEVAATLPVFLRRVGCSLVRKDGRPDRLSPDDVATLAMRAHDHYRDTASLLGNPTNSRFADARWEELTEHERRSNVAQVLDIPVKLALLGLGWDAVQDVEPSSGGAGLVRYAFAQVAIEKLAAQEHRRWAYFEVRNGRKDNDLTVSWSKIRSTPVGDYDRRACQKIPESLALVGLRIVGSAGRPLSESEHVIMIEPVEAEAEETDAIAGPRRFKRRGRAWAWKLDEDFDWSSPRDQALKGRAGDWWVIGEDGSSRTVDPESFAATHEQVEAQEYRRIGIVTAVRVAEHQVVPTREGDAVAEPGDWMVTDDRGTTWPVPATVFEVLHEEE